MKNESFLWSPRRSAGLLTTPSGTRSERFVIPNDPEPTPEAQQARGRVWSKACYFCGARCQCPPGGYGKA